VVADAGAEHDRGVDDVSSPGDAAELAGRARAAIVEGLD
jgi:hypothetical protein